MGSSSGGSRAQTHTFPRPSIVHTDAETELAVIRAWLAAVDPCGGIYTFDETEEVKGKNRKENSTERVVLQFGKFETFLSFRQKKKKKRLEVIHFIIIFIF